jgi:flagellar basal body-associated protein FliL
MLIASTVAGFGQTPTPSDTQVSAVTATGQSLSDAETRLRNSFGRLFLVLDTFDKAKKKLPPEFVTLMEKFNTAQAAYTEAANFWLIARAGTDKAQLPDPNNEPQEVPKFDIPASSAGLFGAPAKIAPSSVGIIYGAWGKTKRATLGEYGAYHYTAGLGVAFIPVAIFVIALVAITGAVIISVFGKSQAAADIAANQAATAKALARQAEVESDERALTNIINACVGKSDDPAVRQQCTETALDKFPGVQAGRPDTKVPGARGRSIFAIIGVITVLGLVGTGGYFIYRRYKRRTALPEARVRSRAAYY